MVLDTGALFKRYTKLTTEIEIAKRKREEEATKLLNALRKISKDDVELLKKYVPQLEDITRFTSEQLLNNRNGELDAVASVYESLTNILDSWLRSYEDSLC